MGLKVRRKLDNRNMIIEDVDSDDIREDVKIKMF